MTGERQKKMNAEMDRCERGGGGWEMNMSVAWE